MSAPELKEERAMLLEEWLNIESSFGEFGDVNLVQSKLPKKLKKRRQIVSDDGLPTGYVAYSKLIYAPLLTHLNCYYIFRVCQLVDPVLIVFSSFSNH